MAISESEGMGTTMLVQPSGYAGMGNGFGGFGGDGWWLILLFLLVGGNGWGMGGFGGGFGGYEFPWLFNGQNNINANTNAGFRDAMLNDGINGIRDGISGISTQLCNGFAGVNAGVANGFAQAEIAANARQIADMQTTFGLQSALQNCCCENRAGIADLKYTVATENCADRAAVSDGIRDVLAANAANTQKILDQLCQDKIDAKNETIANLRQELAMKDLAASQIAQNSFIQKGFTDEVDALYTRLSNCPVPSTPVYGRTPIFTCGGGTCGCGCGGTL
jgi:hypothetical protein